MRCPAPSPPARPLCLAVILAVLLCASPSMSHAAGRDGRSFDTGSSMAAPAAGAPEELNALVAFLGTWRVEWTRGSGEEAATADCEAEVTLFNRGHGYMERLWCADWDGAGRPLATLALVTYNPANQVWVRGAANSVSESITVSQGQLVDGRLTLHDAIRPGGGALLRHSRLGLDLASDRPQWTVEHSIDDGATWQPFERRSYRRVDRAPGLDRRDDYGSPAEGLPAEARQFDFLIGEWTARNELTFPNGQQATWPAEATAVFALDGHAILEYNWFDVDPQLPDAATTVLRLYNRAMRRWESLFMPNRGHSILHFGGRWEDDRMVLHLFGVNTAASSIPRFVFHSIEPDRFGWFSEVSTDRGATFSKNWIIDTVRKRAAAPAEE